MEGLDLASRRDGRSLGNQSALSNLHILSRKDDNRRRAVKRSGPEAACKPSSVPDRGAVYALGLRPTNRPAAAIYLALPLPEGSCGQPGDGPGTHSPAIRPCSGWGLPGLRCHHRSGGLLPHHFTLTPTSRGGMFLWHFPSGRPAPPLAGIQPGGARTFLPDESERPPGNLGPDLILAPGRCADYSGRTPGRLQGTGPRH